MGIGGLTRCDELKAYNPTGCVLLWCCDPAGVGGRMDCGGPMGMDYLGLRRPRGHRRFHGVTRSLGLRAQGATWPSSSLHSEASWQVCARGYEVACFRSSTNLSEPKSAHVKHLVSMHGRTPTHTGILVPDASGAIRMSRSTPARPARVRFGGGDIGLPGAQRERRSPFARHPDKRDVSWAALSRSKSNVRRRSDWGHGIAATWQ